MEVPLLPLLLHLVLPTAAGAPPPPSLAGSPSRPSATPFVCERGHYRPSSSCFFGGGLEVWPTGRVVAPVSGAVEPPSGKIDGGSAFQMWNVSLRGSGAAEEELASGKEQHFSLCGARVDTAVLFSVHYMRGGSNNYHLHWDSLMPLYALLRRRGLISSSSPSPHQKNAANATVNKGLLLMPTVEMGYLPGYTEGPVWDTDAFDAIPLTAAGGDGGATDQQTVVLPDGTEDADTPNAGTEAAAEVIAPYWVAAPSLFSDRELLPLTHQHVESWVSGFTSGASSGFASGVASGAADASDATVSGATVAAPLGPLCAGTAIVGLPPVDWKEWQPKQFVNDFADFVVSRMAARRGGNGREGGRRGRRGRPTVDGSRGRVRIGYVTRRLAKRRRVLNEDGVLAMLRRVGQEVLTISSSDGAAGDVEVEEVLFEGATFEEQVAAVGTFDLLVGLQGAGMTNAIYRRRGTAVVLLFPLSDMDNVGIWDPLLPARGPYLRWFNRDAASSVVPDPTIDPYGDNPDTIVHLGELEAVVREALAQVVGAGGAEGTEGTDT